MNKKNVKKLLTTGASIVAGNALLAFLVAAFVIPNQLIMGGATGIGLVLSVFVPAGTAVIVLGINLLMLLLGWAVLGRRFFVTTVASSLLYPLFLGMMQGIPGITSFTQDPLLASMLAGGLLGIAVGLVMRVGASTGGTDALNLCLHKWFHLPISVFVYATDIGILLAQAMLSDVEGILYGIVLLVTETLVLNRMLLLGQSQLQLLVISDRHEEIRTRILTQLHAGATMIMIENGCSRQAKKGVMSVIPPRKLYDANQLIQQIDPDAFITITQIKEVRGRGFTLEREEFPFETETTEKSTP